MASGTNAEAMDLALVSRDSGPGSIADTDDLQHDCSGSITSGISGLKLRNLLPSVKGIKI